MTLEEAKFWRSLAAEREAWHLLLLAVEAVAAHDWGTAAYTEREHDRRIYDLNSLRKEVAAIRARGADAAPEVTVSEAPASTREDAKQKSEGPEVQL